MTPPHFWSAGLDPQSREAAPLTRVLLTPLEALYVWGFRRRLSKTKPAEPQIPLICVGNLTVGGVGKTPIVRAIRARLLEQGLRAATLSRGYGGREKGPLQVTPDHHTAADVGDEALMLTDSGESWIGRSRPHAVEAMAAAGVDVVIMDDGHQNPSLEKTLSLVAIDSAAPFGNGYCLPKGPLREPVAGGLSRSDAVLIVGDGPIPRLVLESGKPVLRARLQPTTKAPQGPLVAFAGIGRPQKFFDSLKNAGAQVAEGVGYGDHQTYSPSDLSFLSRLAEDHEARLITTEKDFARLPSSQRDSILIWPIEAAFEDPSALDGLVAVALQTLQS